MFRRLGSYKSLESTFLLTASRPLMKPWAENWLGEVNDAGPGPRAGGPSCDGLERARRAWAAVLNLVAQATGRRASRAEGPEGASLGWSDASPISLSSRDH